MGQKRPKMEHLSHPGRLVDILYHLVTEILYQLLTEIMVTNYNDVTIQNDF